MKRFLTTGLSALMLSALLVPTANAETVAPEQPQSFEKTEAQTTVKPVKVQAIKPTQETNTETETISERDLIILQYRYQRLIPPQE